MSYSNGLLPDQSYQTVNKYVQRGLPGVGFKFTDTGDYDMQNKKLVNVDEGENNQDVVNKHQLDVGLQTKPNKTSVLLLDGTTHMVGDLDLRGNKIILPGEIQMDRKLITNLDTDENQDLSAVNMITLKNKVEPKADKNYVDFEITKQNALINNAFVKKTGDQMNGDLILPHDSYPVGGNTNKAISYETQREIFLSRQESFPMQADINMNNNFIQNIAAPTSSHQVVNKGYCDYNFLNRQKGGRIMASLSMNQNDLFEIPAPKYESSAANKNYVDNQMGTKADLSKTTTQTFQGRVQVPDFNSGRHNGSDIVNLRYIDGIFLNKKTGGTLNNPITFLSSLPSNQRQIHNIGSPQFISSAVNKQYVDGEIGKIAPVDTTQFIKKDGSVPMAADLDMGTHKISNVVNPEFDTDVVNKQYLENKLIESHLQPSGPSNIFHFLMNDTSKFSSIREIIIGSFSDVEKVAHRLNKKALSILLQNDLQTVSYSARLGLDMTSLSVGDHTLVMEFYWPEKFNIYTYADSTPTNIVDEQNIKNFSNYQKLYLQFTKKNTNSPNNLIMEIRGELSTSNQQTGYLIFYGAKGTHYSITNDFYDQYIMSDIFIYNENMKMQTKIDMNNNKIINLANPTDDGDACNKRYVDIVDTKINDLSYYTKDHRYKNVFGEDVYDLIETSRFNLIQGVSGVVINGVLPNFVLETDRFITDYNPKYGLKLSTKTHIRTADIFNQNSSFTFFMSFMHDNTKTGEISFSNTLNIHIKFYPRYRITSNKLIIDYQSGTHETTFTSDFQNKQLFVWICFDGTRNLYKMALSNYSSHVSETFSPPVNFQSRQLEIDYEEVYVNKIGFTNRFIDVNSLEHHRIMLEEKRNGSYL